MGFLYALQRRLHSPFQRLLSQGCPGFLGDGLNTLASTEGGAREWKEWDLSWTPPSVLDFVLDIRSVKLFKEKLVDFYNLNFLPGLQNTCALKNLSWPLSLPLSINLECRLLFLEVITGWVSVGQLIQRLVWSVQWNDTWNALALQLAQNEHSVNDRCQLKIFPF